MRIFNLMITHVIISIPISDIYEPRYKRTFNLMIPHVIISISFSDIEKLELDIIIDIISISFSDISDPFDIFFLFQKIIFKQINNFSIPFLISKKWKLLRQNFGHFRQKLKRCRSLPRWNFSHRLKVLLCIKLNY